MLCVVAPYEIDARQLLGVYGPDEMFLRIMPGKQNTPYNLGEDFQLPAWRSDWKLLHSFCENYWHVFLFERKKADPAGANLSTADGVTTWCLNFQERHGRLYPAVVGAAAMFRRYLLYLVASQLPEAGIPDPYDEDAFELAVAGAPDWERAVELALADVNLAKGLIAAARPEWGLTDGTEPPTLLRLLKEERETQLTHFKELTRPQFSATRLEPLHASRYTLFPADRINKAIVEALAHGALKALPAGYLEPFGADATFWRAYPFGVLSAEAGKDQLIGAVGWRERPDAELWRTLGRNRALAVKIQFALWARAFLQRAADGTGHVTLTIPQLCDDLGIGRHNGSHRQDRRLAVEAVLKLLTSMEMVCVYQPPNEPPQRIRGPVWTRVPTSQAGGRYKDMFAEREESDSRSGRSPKAFSYSPGPFFSHHAWHSHNRYVARVDAGFLKLTCGNRDKWAVIVAAYLSILARINGYRRVKLNVQTLLEKTGLWAFDRKKHPERMQHKLETALDLLKAKKVIRSWARINSAKNNRSDTAEDEQRAERWFSSWTAQLIEVDWPDSVRDEVNPAGRGRRRPSR